MVDQSVLACTADLYRVRARDDERYAFPRDVLDGALQQLTFTDPLTPRTISNSDNLVVLRTTGLDERPVLIRHPIDLIESAIDSSVEALRIGGMLDEAHTCIIAVPRGSLSASFTSIYEVVRRCGWSILPLGGSDDGQDISDLCNAYAVDTIFMPARALDSVFTRGLTGRFEGVRTVLFVAGLPPLTAINVLASHYPHIALRPFVYTSDITGPIALPSQDARGHSYDVVDNVLLEVLIPENGAASLNGFGSILVSVLGLEDPTLIRQCLGDVGKLTTSEDGRQVIELH
jgi:hypothetical protein